MSTENALLTILVEKINNDTLVLPTLPAVALKVREAADNPDVNLQQMADVIGQDPSLSARMIKIANSAYLGRSVKVESLNQAVTRIGLRQIKNIATALAMEQLFVSKNDVVKDYMSKVWDSTIEVVANALAAYQLYKKKRNDKTLNVDTLTLMALIHRIGVLPILTEAERHDEVFANPSFLNVAVHKLAAPIGASIMRNWAFGDSFVQVAERWNDLKHNPEKIDYVDFVRLGAALADVSGVHKDDVLNICQRKDMFDDLDDLHSDEFSELKSSAKQIFA